MANVASCATALVPGIVAAAKSNGDPAEPLVIGVQLAASVITRGGSDYFFDEQDAVFTFEHPPEIRTLK